MNIVTVRKRQFRLFRISTCIALIVAAMAVPVTPARTDDGNVSVSCYKGNPDQKDYLGNMMVYAPETAAQSCNSFYYDCKGKCYGCFSDFDLSEDVCYDTAGRKFLK